MLVGIGMLLLLLLLSFFGVVCYVMDLGPIV